MTKSEAGRLGGRATVKKHGKSHMVTIGKLGAEVTWTKYKLQPVGLNQFAMVEIETNRVEAII